MKTLVAIIVASVGLELGAVGAVQAGDLFTPPVFVADNENFACGIVNVGPRTRLVHILINNGSGGTTGDSGNLSLAPGAVASWVNVDVNQQFRYCHFIVEGGKKEHYRAVGCVFVDAGSSRDCVAAE